jgi:hypothetical protein
VSGVLAPPATTPKGLRNANAIGIGADLSAGGLASPIDATTQTPLNGKLSWTGPGSGNLTLTVAASGQVTGSFIDPGTGKKRTVLGLWLASQQTGGGFFLGDDSTGALTLSGP